MTLLNSLLALGALAFTIPLAIHLLHRSRFKTLDWGAWHLLDSIVRVNRRRMQLANLLLLLLRCLIPILLAFCLARPVLTGFRSLPGDAPRTVVIVVDDSRSMNAANAGQPSRMELAKTGLLDLMKGLSRRDEVILLPSSAIDSPPSSMGASQAAERISQLKADSGPVDLASAINAAVAAAKQSSHGETSVLVVSDFQSCNVSAATIGSLESISQQLQSIQPAPAIRFWNLGTHSEDLMNLSVDAISIDSPAVVANRNAQFSARIQNASDTPTGELRVVWTIDEVALPPRRVSIDERSTATARLSHRFDQAGVHAVTVSVEHADSLADDNRRSIAVDVMRQIDVLLVDGKPSSQPLEGAADWLSIALSPFAFGGDDQPDSVATQVIREQKLVDALETNAPEIVMLANVRSLVPKQQSALASFVLKGGSLVIFDGNNVRPADFNAIWESDEGLLSLPARLGDIVGTPKTQNAAVVSLGQPSTQYSPWQILSTASEQPLADVEVFAYRKLTLADAANDSQNTETDQNNAPPTDSERNDSDQNASVLLRFGDGAPAVVLARRGRGQVCQFAVPCDASWTTLPMRFSYLPMMQQLVLDLAGRRKDTTLDVGQPISVPLTELEFASRTTDGDENSKSITTYYTISVPGEDEARIEPTENRPPDLRWLQTNAPGSYVFRAVHKVANPKNKQSSSEASTESITRTLRIVEVPALESQLRSAGSDRLGAVAERLDATIFTDLSDFQNEDQTRRFGREIWRWLLMLLLVAMVGELFLQQNLLGRRVTGGLR